MQHIPEHTEVAPKRSPNLRSTLVGARTSWRSPICTISWARRVKRLSIGYRDTGEGPGRGVPLPVMVFWDNLTVCSSRPHWKSLCIACRVGVCHVVLKLLQPRRPGQGARSLNPRASPRPWASTGSDRCGCNSAVPAVPSSGVHRHDQDAVASTC